MNRNFRTMQKAKAYRLAQVDSRFDKMLDESCVVRYWDLPYEFMENGDEAFVTPSMLEAKVENVVEDYLGGMDFSEEISEQVENFDFSYIVDDAVEVALNEADLDYKVDRAVAYQISDYDFSGTVEDAIGDYDFSYLFDDYADSRSVEAMIEDAINEFKTYELDDAVDEAVDRSMNCLDFDMALEGSAIEKRIEDLERRLAMAEALLTLDSVKY